MKKEFQESSKRLSTFVGGLKAFNGYVLWEVDLPFSRLECWQHNTLGPVIFQVYSANKGFCCYSSIPLDQL